jgi:hypothetical protein
MMISQNKNVCQLVWHLYYVNTAVESSELYCYNTEGDINSVVSQASCKMEVTRLEQHAYSGLWALWGIILKFCEYEYGMFLNCLYVS